jgi:xanthine dehydrogenase accessory factor
MLVWADGAGYGQTGTIGGGALEPEVTALARGLDQPRVLTRALGPDLGQCCGGRVTLVLEPFDAVALAQVPESGVYARALSGSPMPLAVTRLLSDARGQGVMPAARIFDGWLVEAIHTPAHPVWVWGAGHVGRAIVSVLAPLTDLALTWADTGADRFPAAIPAGVTAIPAADLALLAAHAPPAHHLILTYSHAIDLALCDALLRRPAHSIGLIGSATKWARFRARLAAMGHGPAQISRIACPIGDPALGKHPQAIALGVAAALIRSTTRDTAQKDRSA